MAGRLYAKQAKIHFANTAGTMQNLRWGIIGVGRFGLIHARVLQSLSGSELVAICNRNQERLDQAAAALDLARCYTDYEQLLADPEVDVVSITTHWQQHFELARAALASGKHVLLEKPLAATGEQCRQLVAAAEYASGHFMVGHVCRFDPRVTLAKRAIDEGRVGRIVSMHAKRNLPRAPGHIRLDKISPLMGDGVHDADLMMWFLGRPPSRVYGRQIHFGEMTYPEIGWGMLEFEDQAVGIVETNWGLPPNVPTVIDARMEVVGTEGMLTVDCANTGLQVLDPSGLKMIDTSYWPEQYGQPIGALREELAYFARCIHQQQPPTVVTPAEAAQAVIVMEAVERSASLGEPVEL